MIIYLSGPISLGGSLPKEVQTQNLERINHMAAELEKIGHHVRNPAAIELPKGSTWQDYMRVCIPLICQSEGIYMYGEWWVNRGCLFEFNLAMTLGLKLLDRMIPLSTTT